MRWARRIRSAPKNRSKIVYLVRVALYKSRLKKFIYQCFQIILIVKKRKYIYSIYTDDDRIVSHCSARCGWFQTCFGSAASAFEIIELA